MSLNYHVVKNWQFPEIRQMYDEKFAITYALGLNLGGDVEDLDHLQYVYENGLVTLPTFPVVLGFPGNWMKSADTGIDWMKGWARAHWLRSKEKSKMRQLVTCWLRPVKSLFAEVTEDFRRNQTTDRLEETRLL